MIVSFVEAARGSLKLLAASQLPAPIRTKIALSDLVQLTAIEAFRSADRFEGTTRLEVYAWLQAILRNNVIDAIRRYRDTQSRDVRRERSLDALDFDERHDQALIGRIQPELSAMQSEENSVVSRSLALLPEPHATVVRLRIWEDLQFHEIANRCGRSDDAVRKIFYRSIDLLRKRLRASHPSVFPACSTVR